MVSYCSPLLYPLGISSEYRLPLSGLSFPFPPDAPPLFPVPLMLDLDLCWWSNRSSCCCCGSFNPGYDRSLGLGRPASISGEMRSVIVLYRTPANKGRTWYLHVQTLKMVFLLQKGGPLPFFIALGTVWKFQDFCIIQILREINFGDSWSAKSANLPHLEALTFDFYEFLHFLKAAIYQINNIHSPWNGKNGSFCTSGILKIDFT